MQVHLRAWEIPESATLPMRSTPFDGFLDLIERMETIRFSDEHFVGMVRKRIAPGFPLEGSQAFLEGRW